jgi:hypothetical protein
MIVATYSDVWDAAPAAGWGTVAMAYVLSSSSQLPTHLLLRLFLMKPFPNAFRAKGVAVSTATI